MGRGEAMDRKVAVEVPGLDKHESEDLELGEALSMNLDESELTKKSISVPELAMTDSKVAKHPMDNKLAVMVNCSRVAYITIPSRFSVFQ